MGPSEAVAEKVHYLPHHAVIWRDKETTKVRVVYDASTKSDGPSLNDCLHAGPKFGQKILDILLRFWVHRVAVTTDIEKAFLMISMAEKDRDVLYFLWLQDVSAEQPEVIELRFTRFMFGVSSSPFLLNATIRHHLEKYNQTHPDLVKKLSNSTYVDNIVTGAANEDQAHQIFKESKKILKDGGFNLRRFCSNSASLQARIDQDKAKQASEHHHQKTGLTGRSEETYTSSTLGPARGCSQGSRKCSRSGGISPWISSWSTLMRSPRSQESLNPQRGTSSVWWASFTTHLDSWHLPLSSSRCSFRNSVRPSLSGISLSSKLLEKWHSLRSGLEEGQPFTSLVATWTAS